MYERILVALDGSRAAEEILPHVEALAGQFGSKVTLLQATTADRSRVAPPQAATNARRADDDTMERAEVERHTALAYLAPLAERLAERGIAVDSVPAPGSPGEVIVEAARAHSADLIAMATRGGTGISLLGRGSIADEVVGKAPCPVLLLRVQEST